MLKYEDTIKIIAKKLAVEYHDNALLDMDEPDIDLVVQILDVVYDNKDILEDLLNEMEGSYSTFL